MLKDNLVKFLNENNYDYLLVNSTNEFLVEYNELEQNARYYLTGFSGSTGEALLSKNGQLFLFVDGRYHKQADNQAFPYVNVVKLQLGETFLSALVQKIAPKSKLAVVSNKIPLSFYNNAEKAFENVDISIIPLTFDPVFNYIEKKSTKTAPVIDVPVSIAGVSSNEKILSVQNSIKENEARLITNLEQIAWLLNKRTFAQNFASSFNAKMVIEKNNYKVFYANEQDRYYKYLSDTKKTILYSPKYLSYGDYLIIKNKSTELITDDLEEAKSIKNPAELNHIKFCFKQTDKVVNAVAKYVNSASKLTEQELVKFAEKEFFKQGAVSLSFNTILASGKNSALAHYSTDINKITPIKEGDFVLLDCGAYFEGGYATDITRVFCFGKPSKTAQMVYTTVLKANLNAYHSKITKNLTGFDLDKKARDIINANLPKTYNFNHSTGHGVGIGVHEFPPSLSPSEAGKKQLKNGMVFTIEPGAYNPDFGGVRLENTVCIENNKIVSLSKMHFEEKLIDYSLLSEQELKWLKDWQQEAL